MKQVITVPAGTYVLGDPCYSLDEKGWDNFLDATDFMSHQAEKDGKMAFGFKTAYGDGCYTGSDGNDYGVDSGSIGLIHVDIVWNWSPKLCTLVTFDKPTVCTNDNGRMKFGNIRINTK